MRYSYVLPSYASVSDVGESCSVDLMLMVLPWGPVKSCSKSCSYDDEEVLEGEEEVKGIQLKWRCNRCGDWKGGGDDGTCFLDNATNLVFCHTGAGFWKSVSGEFAILCFLSFSDGCFGRKIILSVVQSSNRNLFFFLIFLIDQCRLPGRWAKCG